ncbi:hypothetical protein KFK09_023044 [Dendrobium nobile]|uniref:Uncharacterized protein n=1 Tax=Dendrobium nobile TaxID=94219 RepID=A0A8T3AKT2_DENNO|nr:hypothetical protein KFK09_023044 [Dendrobium nobile]
MMNQKTSGEIAEQEKSSIRLSNFLHLFDEQWFFCNALNGDLVVTKKSLHERPPQPPAAAAETEVAETTVKIEKMDSFSTRQLMRTPSLPPRVRCDGSGGQEEEAGPRNYCSGRKLRYSYSSLDDPVQQSISSSSSSKSAGRRRPPRTERPHRRCANPHLLLCWEASNRKAFQSKKWRSLGDLETMELQGFKDLGFVFDERKEEEEDGGQKRLFLPEGWFTQRSAPPVVLRRVGCWSGEEMKEQLRFWARAVACNVRRDC